MEYGLIGAKLGHSYSKVIHEMICDYQYDLCPLPTEQEAHDFMKRRNFKAINVTIPYKQLVIPYCDFVDPKALEIHAVNTVVNRGGKLYGYNTDYAGFAYLMKSHDISAKGKNVLILGTGGTSNTTAAVCRDMGSAAIFKATRKPDPAKSEQNLLTYAQAKEHKEIEIIINTTPLGTYPNVGQMAIDPAQFPNLEAVLDVVYNPFKTEIILRAEELGVPAYSGFEMLVAQAVFAAEHFLSQQINHEEIRRVHAILKKEISNVSLVGMPSAGKRSIGLRLAKKLGKRFVDTDALVEQRAGKTIPEILKEDGEKEFRRLENRVIADVSKENRQLICTGGGCLETVGTARLLHQNGPILWIERPVEELTVGGEYPLSTSRAELEKMERARRPQYEGAADEIIRYDTSFMQAVIDAMDAIDRWFEMTEEEA